MIVVIDTNVLLSAAYRDRLPERVLLFLAGNDDWRWLVTSAILAKYVEVLKRPKFGLSEELVKTWADLLALRTVAVSDLPSTAHPLRDPKDAPFLSVALGYAADYLITGDQDLLVLTEIASTKIVTVSDFSAAFGIA